MEEKGFCKQTNILGLSGCQFFVSCLEKCNTVSSNKKRNHDFIIIQCEINHCYSFFLSENPLLFECILSRRTDRFSVITSDSSSYVRVPSLLAMLVALIPLPVTFWDSCLDNTMEETLRAAFFVSLASVVHQHRCGSWKLIQYTA